MYTGFFRAPKHGLQRAAWRASALAAALMMVFPAHAGEGRLTLETALREATTHSALAQAAQAGERASAQAAVRAGQLPDPMFKAGIDNLPVTGPGRFSLRRDDMTMQRIGISQEWVSADKRRLRSQQAQQVVKRQRAAFLQQIASVRQQTASAWLTASYASRALGLQQALVDHMQHELEVTQAAYKGNAARASDVVQSQGMVVQTQDDTLKARQQWQNALIALQRWTAGAVDDVQGDPPAPLSSVETMGADQLRERQPALIAAADDVAVAQADTAVADSERHANWSWEVAYQRRSLGSDMVSVGVSIPLQFNQANLQDRYVAEKAARATQAEFTLDDIERQVLADIRSQANTLSSARARLDSLRKRLLPLAQQRVQLAEAAYRSGAGALADVFAARRADLQAQLQVLDLQREAALVWAQLEYQVLPMDDITTAQAGSALPAPPSNTP